MFMYYYAVLNTKDIVEYISEQETEVTYYEYISIPTADQSLVGKWYDREGVYGTVGAFLEVPISIQAEHSSSQINYKGQDVWLDEKLDSYATQSDLSSGLAGKANVSHFHDTATQTSDGYMSSGDKAKLDGIEANANLYVHPDTHAASMITGLSDVAQSGSYNDLTDRPTIPTIPTALPADGGNADTLDGYHAAYFASGQHNHDAVYAPANHTHDYAATYHTHEKATTSEAGFMSAEDKTKLNGIASGANNYTHPASHPASMITGLSDVATSGSYNDLSDTPTSMTPKAHTHAQSDITGLATALSGKANSSHTHAQSDITGLATALSGKSDTSHSHSNATTTAAGFMSKDDKSKLDGIATGANKTTVDTALSSTSTNPVQNKVVNTALSGKANTSHTHTQSQVTGLETALAGKAASSHSHAQSDITGLATALSGKSDTSHSHSVATTSAAGFMSKDDKTKLNGIATGANNYTHPSTHAASMITGLAGVATSGSYTDLTDKPTSMTPTAHSHAQSDITGLATALNGKASTGHTHSAASTTANGFMSKEDKTKLNGIATGANKTTVDSALSSTSTNPVQNKVINTALAGKASTSHNHNSAYIAKSLQMTADDGDVEVSWTNQDVVAKIKALGSGMTTAYASIGTTNNPNSIESFRFMVHKTGSAKYGWVMAFGGRGSVYTGYVDNGTWRDWKAIFEASPAPLWKGAMYMSSPDSTPQTVTPSKKLSECRNGWLLLWSDYDKDTKKANDSDFVTTMIPKRNPTGGNWGGKAFYCDIPRYIGSNVNDVDTERRIIKSIYIHDNCIKGSFNNDKDERNDVVLRAVYEF